MSGKYASHTKKKFPWVLVIAVLVVLAVAAVILLSKLIDSQPAADIPTEPTNQTTLTEPVQEEIIEPEQPESTEPEQKTDPITDLQIDTPYCTLRYPAQWNGCVKMVTDQKPNRYSVTFVGMIGEHEAELFAIVFGESTEMPVGTLAQDDGTEITVRLNVDMFIADDSWSADEESQAYEMIGDSAYVLEALAELENFQ